MQKPQFISENTSLSEQLNNFKKENEITSFLENLVDRFGTIPESIYNVTDALRLKWLSKKIGFERIILKNNMMRAFLPKESESPYYNSDAFKKILEYLKQNFSTCKLNENKGKLSLSIKNIKSINAALKATKNIMQ